MVIEQAATRRWKTTSTTATTASPPKTRNPWRKQLNIYLGYASFYNPLNFVRAVASWKDPLWTYRVMYQAYGMVGLAKSVVQGFGWLRNLYKGPVRGWKACRAAAC